MFVKLTFALVTAASLFVPPGFGVADHSQPMHYTQPVLRTCERCPEDAARGEAYHRFCQELDAAWKEYRDTGSTDEGFRIYKSKAAAIRRNYVYGDPYLAPIVN